MDFTKDALERVRTLKFAQMIDDYLSPWREQGLSDLEVTKLLAALVGWAATGHAVTEPPAGKNSYELTAFTLSHVEEIDNLCDIVGKNILDLRRRH